MNLVISVSIYNWIAGSRSTGASWARQSRAGSPLGVSFFVVFPGGVLERLLFYVRSHGCHLGAFWETFSDILKVCGIVLDGTHSHAKHHFMRFGRSLVSTSSYTFPGMDFRVYV